MPTGHKPSGTPSFHHKLGIAYAAALSISVAYGLYYSMHWVLYSDASIYHYIAWRILHGAVPYRDIFQVDFPGTYLLHMFCQTVFGTSDLAFRLFDLFLSLLTAVGIALYAWNISKPYAIAGGLFFIACHLSWGAISMGERDFMTVPFLIFAAYALKRFIESPHHSGWLFVFGMLAGYTVWIKPLPALFIMLGVGAAWLHSEGRRNKLLAVCCIAAGALVPAIIIHLWLYWAGGLLAFYDMLFHFLGTYASAESFVWAEKLPFLLFNFYALSVALFLLYRRSTVSGADKTILAIGLCYGMANYYLQNKWLWYYWYPLRAFWCLFFAVAIPQLKTSRWESSLVQLLIVSACIHFSPLQALSKDRLSFYRNHFSLSFIRQVESNVDAALQTVPEPIRESYVAAHPHQEVAFLSMFADMTNAAYRLHWMSPSPYFYPAVFLSSEPPYLAALREHLFQTLNTIKPLVIIITMASWPERDGAMYQAIEAQPPWQAFFSSYYRLATDSGQYRIYARIK